MNKATIWQQFQRLIEMGVDEAAGFTESQLQRFLLMPKKDGGLLIVSERLLNLQMQCVLLGIKNEMDTEYNIENHQNIVPVPDTLLYWRYDVEDGAAMLKVSTLEAMERFKTEGRLPCTTAEVLAIYRENPAVIADPKKGHFIDAAGSRVKNDEYMPGLGMVNGTGREQTVSLMVNHQLENGFNRWGAASCQAE